MLTLALQAALTLTAVALLLNVVRLLRGPSLPDRVLALDTLYINALALIILASMLWRTTLHFEAAVLIAAIGFFSTVAVAKFLCRGDIIE
ncbi:MAG: K+/H+ antiporter subunit F [Spongiibacteraceae bacterium]|jgi:multicomponent K+:H+ antiporter subunit F|nr:K+/H+ antiporter subunit F [Spongiibacteraceae bacterium]